MPDQPASGPSAVRALRQVDHAVADFRRGEKVVLLHDGANLLLEAAETLTSEALARLARPRRRAALIGRAAAPQGPGGTVVIPIPEGSEVEFLRILADPAASADAPEAHDAAR